MPRKGLTNFSAKEVPSFYSKTLSKVGPALGSEPANLSSHSSALPTDLILQHKILRILFEITSSL